MAAQWLPAAAVANSRSAESGQTANRFPATADRQPPCSCAGRAGTGCELGSTAAELSSSGRQTKSDNAGITGLSE